MNEHHFMHKIVHAVLIALIDSISIDIISMHAITVLMLAVQVMLPDEYVSAVEVYSWLAEHDQTH